MGARAARRIVLGADIRTCPRKEVQPRINSELDLISQEISQVLTEKQQKVWIKNFQTFRKTWVPEISPPDSLARP